MATYAFAQLVMAPLWGRASDRYGRRPMILAGLLASGIAYVLFGLARQPVAALRLPLRAGRGSGGITGVVQAYVADAVAPEERAKALGWVTAATSAGVMFGPAMGSFAARPRAGGAGLPRRRPLPAQRPLRLALASRAAGPATAAARHRGACGVRARSRC